MQYMRDGTQLIAEQQKAHAQWYKPITHPIDVNNFNKHRTYT